jgi:ribosomal protein S18 acetylase RimI-like enzyme
MSVETRPATADDAPFLAWVMQEAARSHLERGVWDLAFPGEEARRLDVLARLATTEQIHFAHHSRFRVLEVDGVLASGLSAYENAEHGIAKLTPALIVVLSELGWTPEQMQAMSQRISSFDSTGYPNPDGLWIIEWVATRPEFRGRSLIHRLLEEILEQGREAGFTRSQIGYLLGNVRAKGAYEGVGFEWLEEHRHPDFEADYGTPGVARMQRDL